MESVNILFDKEVFYHNNYVLEAGKEGYDFDFYSCRFYPVNFDKSVAKFDSHLPLAKLISKYYPSLKINEISLNELKDDDRFIYGINFHFFYSYFRQNTIQSLLEKLMPAVRQGFLEHRGVLLLNDSHEFASYINYKDRTFVNVLNNLKGLDEDLYERLLVVSGNPDNECYKGTDFKGTDASVWLKVSSQLINKVYNHFKNDRITVLGFRYFEEVVAAQTKTFYSAFSYAGKLSKLKNPDFKHFICLNNVNKDFRTVLSYRIVQEGLKDKFCLSHRNINENIVSGILRSKWRSVIDKHAFADFVSSLPYNMDVDYGIGNPWNIMPWNLVEHSFCWLVTETLYEGDIYSRGFFTEKTYKPISVFMPFILVAQPFSLCNLKKEGYLTFDRWWDESYDTESDDVKRMEKIMQNVSAICKLDKESLLKMYVEMQPVLEHNYNHLMNTRAAQKYIDKLVDVYFS